MSWKPNSASCAAITFITLLNMDEALYRMYLNYVDRCRVKVNGGADPVEVALKYCRDAGINLKELE